MRGFSFKSWEISPWSRYTLSRPFNKNGKTKYLKMLEFINNIGTASKDEILESVGDNTNRPGYLSGTFSTLHMAELIDYDAHKRTWSITDYGVDFVRLANSKMVRPA